MLFSSRQSCVTVKKDEGPRERVSQNFSKKKSCVVFCMLKMLQACTITIVHVEELPTQIYSSCVEAVPSRLATISVVYERENVCVFLLLHAHSFWKGPHCSKLLQCRPFILK